MAFWGKELKMMDSICLHCFYQYDYLKDKCPTCIGYRFFRHRDKDWQDTVKTLAIDNSNCVFENSEKYRLLCTKCRDYYYKKNPSGDGWWLEEWCKSSMVLSKHCYEANKNNDCKYFRLYQNNWFYRWIQKMKEGSRMYHQRMGGV